MKRIKIADVFAQPALGKELIVKGWVRGFRNDRFIQLNDGSTIKTLQAVVEAENFESIHNHSAYARITSVGPSSNAA